MPSTEVQRIVLLVLLAVVGYLLVYNWNKDYGRGATEPAPRAAPDAAAPAIAPSVPSAPSPAVAPVEEPLVVDTAGDDVPGEDLAAGGAPAEAAVPAAQLVHVRTPVLEAWIDRAGGDIVGLQLPAYTEAIDSDVPVRLLDRSRSHVYVAQSGLAGRDGLDRSSATRPHYVADRSEYRLDDGELTVALRYANDTVSVVKRFFFAADSYVVTVEHEVVNNGEAEFRARSFAQLKRDASRPDAGGGGFFMGPRPYVGAAFTTPESRYEKIDFDDLDEGAFRADVQGGWAAILQHYFLTAWVGDPEEVNAYNGRRLGDGNYAVGFVGPELVIAPGAMASASAKLYAGPKIQRDLEATAPNLYLAVDYGYLWWLSVPLFKVLEAIFSVVGNWGVAIIALTMVVKALLYPLASAGFRSMAKMRLVMPQMKRLQERHAGDRQKLTQEMMALYKKEGANPFGGCLPLVLQMPVFLALYWVLYESVELRHAPFMLWIDDLAAPDPWFVLPIMYAGSFYVMQLLQPPPADPMQAKVMKMMPIMFTVLFLFFPAGLVLYWLVNNLLSLAQQWYITRSVEKAAAKTA